MRSTLRILTVVWSRVYLRLRRQPRQGILIGGLFTASRDPARSSRPRRCSSGAGSPRCQPRPAPAHSAAPGKQRRQRLRAPGQGSSVRRVLGIEGACPSPALQIGTQRRRNVDQVVAAPSGAGKAGDGHDRVDLGRAPNPRGSLRFNERLAVRGRARLNSAGHSFPAPPADRRILMREGPHPEGSRCSQGA